MFNATVNTIKNIFSLRLVEFNKFEDAQNTASFMIFELIVTLSYIFLDKRMLKLLYCHNH